MTLLNLDQLVALNTKVELHQITVALLSEYYEQYLSPNTYRFELENGMTIDLKFSRKDFCHLVGIQQIAKNRYDVDMRRRGSSRINKYLYSGVNGFKRAKKGKLEFSHLRSIHSSYYDKQMKEEKCNFFHFIHKLLESPKVSVVNFTAVSDSNITCDFIFHDEYDNALLHLGVEQDADAGHFFPRTFFRYYLSNNNHDKFIIGKTPIGIKNKTIIK